MKLIKAVAIGAGVLVCIMVVRRVVIARNVQDKKPLGHSTGTTSSGFPLKLGSKGALVTELQQRLGKSNLPKYGIDGDFGSETLAALRKVTGKSSVDSREELNSISAGSYNPTNPTGPRGYAGDPVLANIGNNVYNPTNF